MKIEDGTTFYPKEFLNSGDIRVKQTKHYIWVLVSNSDI